MPCHSDAFADPSHRHIGPGTLKICQCLQYAGGVLGVPPAASHGCLPPHHKADFCDSSLPAARRAALLAKQLTVPELVDMVIIDAPRAERLRVPAYHYGIEALHGVARQCPF